MPKINNVVDTIRYTACTIILFINKHNDIIIGAAPWRDEKNQLYVTTTPSDMNRQMIRIADSDIIAFFTIRSLTNVDKMLSTNFQPRKAQRQPHERK
jgi:hypothetical protein